MIVKQSLDIEWGIMRILNRSFRPESVETLCYYLSQDGYVITPYFRRAVKKKIDELLKKRMVKKKRFGDTAFTGYVLTEAWKKVMKNLKDTVAFELSKEQPLSVRQLHERIQQRRPCGYHHVKLALDVLAKDGIIEREYTAEGAPRSGYMLSSKWLKQVETIVQNVKSKPHNVEVVKA